MTYRELFDQMALAEQLKCNLRHSWTSSGRQESVAEHSWRLMLLSWFAAEAYPGINREKLLTMCLFHDMGEAFTGDIPAFSKTEVHEEIERAAIADWLAALPSPFSQRLTALFAEFEAQETQEARLCKALDKMETLIQHNEAPLSTWLPLEYEKNQVYGREQCAFSPYTKELQETVKNDCLEKIRRGAGEATP